MSQVLRKTRSEIIANSVCAQSLPKLVNGDMTMCASGVGGHALCYGDEGDPLLRQAADGRYTQIGVTLAIIDMDCHSDHPNGFTNIAYNLDWINQVLNITDESAIEETAVTSYQPQTVKPLISNARSVEFPRLLLCFSLLLGLISEKTKLILHLSQII